MLDFFKPKRARAEAEVMRMCRTSPRMQRITFGGVQVADFLQADGVAVPGAWVKVFLPSGEGRAYTIRSIDHDAATLDLEFVLHGDHNDSGPASAWASQAEVGESVSITGPRDGGFQLPPDASKIALVGDATALPAMQAIAEALPAHITASMYAEVTSVDDRQAIKSAARLAVTWLDEQFAPGEALRQAVMNELAPLTFEYIWMAGESGMVRALRAHCMQLPGLEARRVSAKGYWKMGEAAHRGG